MRINNKTWLASTSAILAFCLLVMCMGEMATKKDEERVSSLFSAIGRIWTADEKYFDAVTGLRYAGDSFIEFKHLKDISAIHATRLCFLVSIFIAF